ncbi:hypothetical protein JW921_07540, partial [Candidatus Fermentibacterales bacterium]|nr:hypothetical protein [Candidatus Fermentibacterales bacterium]
ANHGNDYAWMIAAMWDLEQAVRSVLSYVDSSSALAWDNTLLIVTSDHSNSFMRLDPERIPARGMLPAMEWDGENWSYPDGDVSYGCCEHTNELVTIAARGPVRALELLRSLEGLPPAPASGELLDNTHVFRVLAGCADLDGEPVRHLILVIGDGMNLEHERAASLYLYGDDHSLAWHSDSLFPYRNWCTTWDIDTYDRYARLAGAPAWDPVDFDPALGYDTGLGGMEPLTGSREYFLTPLP